MGLLARLSAFLSFDIDYPGRQLYCYYVPEGDRFGARIGFALHLFRFLFLT